MHITWVLEGIERWERVHRITCDENIVTEYLLSKELRDGNEYTGLLAKRTLSLSTFQVNLKINWCKLKHKEIFYNGSYRRNLVGHITLLL